MLDPDLTNVLKRRIGASLIDLGVVAAVSTIVWRTQLIAFPITASDPISGVPIFDADQVARQTEIAESLNTSFTWNNTFYVLDQSGFVLTALCGLVMFALMFVLIPANMGWSPGKKLLGLEVVDGDGRNPSLVAHATRTAAGIVDVLPIVVPGLVGWVVANTQDHRQRLGDRLAGTYVIDSRVGAKFIDPSVYERRSELRRASGVDSDAADVDEMVQIGDRLGGSPSGLHRPEPEPALRTASAKGSPAQPHPPPLPLPDTEVSSLDTEEISPMPKHRFTVDAHAPTNELGFVDADAPALGLDAPTGERTTPPASSPMPASSPPPASVTAADIDHRIVDELDLHGAPQAIQASAPMPTHRGSPSDQPEWERPVPEPAPVWQPNPSSRNDSTTPDTIESADASPGEAEGSETHTAPAAQGLVWNEQWQAWLFWDAEHGHWLRHDLVNDRWIPIG